MCDVFLFRDLGLFELAVRGRVCGIDDAEVIALVVRHLPERSAIVVDLSEIDGFDEVAAAAIVDAIDLRRSDLVSAALVGHPSVGSMLLAVGAGRVAAVAGSVTAARDALSREAAILAEPLSA
jgi:anti-anti-sigma regulatory factor